MHAKTNKSNSFSNGKFTTVGEVLRHTGLSESVEGACPLGKDTDLRQTELPSSREGSAAVRAEASFPQRGRTERCLQFVWMKNCNQLWPRVSEVPQREKTFACESFLSSEDPPSQY